MYAKLHGQKLHITVEFEVKMLKVGSFFVCVNHKNDECDTTIEIDILTGGQRPFYLLNKITFFAHQQQKIFVHFQLHYKINIDFTKQD